MAHFFGTLEGARGTATRCGTKASGMDAIAAGWGGCVSACVHHDQGQDFASVTFDRWRSHGIRVTLYSGPLVPTPDSLRHAADCIRREADRLEAKQKQGEGAPDG